MNRLILGLDCGGTKTTAALATISEESSDGRDFEILGTGVAGPSNPCSVGEELAYASVTTAIRSAFEVAAMATQSVDSLALCMAGIGRPEEMQRVRAWALSQSLATRIIVTEDVEPVRWAALWETSHSASQRTTSEQRSWERIVTLISGTGSIACCTDMPGGTDIPGTTVRVGGWGYLLGDDGSGFSIGLQGLKSAIAAHDRGLPPTEMHCELLDAMQCRTVPQLIPTVYRIPLPRAEIAALSRIVLRYADHDSHARDIAKGTVESLSQLVRLALQRNPASKGAYLLAVTGGLLDPESSILKGIRQSLDDHQCGPSLVHVVQASVHGALYMAAKALKNPQP
jgi:N-acetylglucosamine kinase-like BadF-type ATPase